MTKGRALVVAGFLGQGHTWGPSGDEGSHKNGYNKLMSCEKRGKWLLPRPAERGQSPMCVQTQGCPFSQGFKRSREDGPTS